MGTGKYVSLESNKVKCLNVTNFLAMSQCECRSAQLGGEFQTHLLDVFSAKGA